MKTQQKLFESCHPHLSFTKGAADYVCPEARAAWRTWQACKIEAVQRAKKSEAYFTEAGNLAKAQGARSTRAALVAHL